MLYLHSLRIRAGMSWSFEDASRFISSMAASIPACEKVMSPIFGSLFLFGMMIFEILVGRNTPSIGETFADIFGPVRRAK